MRRADVNPPPWQPQVPPIPIRVLSFIRLCPRPERVLPSPGEDLRPSADMIQ